MRSEGDDIDVTVRVRKANLDQLKKGVSMGVDATSGADIRIRLVPVPGEDEVYSIEAETNSLVAMVAVPDPVDREPIDN